MVVVSSTSPLNYLILTGHADVLERLYGEIIIPRAVLDELLHPDAPPAVRDWMENRPVWVTVRDAPEGESGARLDPGEQEAIDLAAELNADLVLLDELKGRAVAAERGIKAAGTLGVLREAAAERMLSLPDAIGELCGTSYRVSQRLVAAVLRDYRAAGQEQEPHRKDPEAPPPGASADP